MKSYRKNRFDSSEIKLQNSHLNNELTKIKQLLSNGKFSGALEQITIFGSELQNNSQLSEIIDSIFPYIEESIRLGKIEDALVLIKGGEEVLSYLEEPLSDDIRRKQAKLILFKGQYYLKKGALDHSLEESEKSLVISKDLGDEVAIDHALSIMARTEFVKGRLDNSLNYFEKCLVLSEKNRDKIRIAVALNGIGNVANLNGDLDRAMDYYQRSIKLMKESGNEEGIDIPLHNTGEIYWKKGNFKQAIEFLEQSLVITQNRGNKHEIAYELFFLVQVNVDNDLIEEAKRYLKLLQEITFQNADSKILSQEYRLAKALILKASSRIVHKMEAQILFKEIAGEPVVEHEFTVLSLLNLCDLLLVELKISGTQEILDEVKNVAQHLLTIAKTQASHSLLAEAYWLLARLALLELNLDRSRELLTQAQLLAKERGLTLLTKRISDEHEALLNRLSYWESLIDQRLSIADRLELTALENFIVKMIRKGEESLPELPDEEPVILLILMKSGKTLYSRIYNPEVQKNVQILGGFLMAINSFSTEAFSVKGSLERLTHQEYTLLIHTEVPLMICYAFKGQWITAQEHFGAFIREIHDKTTNWEIITKTAKRNEMLEDSEKEIFDTLADKIFLHYIPLKNLPNPG